MEEDVEQAIMNLKKRKATGSESILNEPIIEAKEILKHPVQKLFNNILYKIEISH